MSFHESFRLNGTDGFYTVMNIPVILNEISAPGKLECTLNTIVPNILEHIPIPRPLTKINGEIVARFTGTNADQQNQFDDGSTSNESPSAALPEDGTTSTKIPDSNNGQVEISVVPSVTTLVETATVQVNSPPPTQTSLDDSDFGGPGGDLTDEGNNNAPEAEQMSSGPCGRCAGIESVLLAVSAWLLGVGLLC